MGVIAMIGLLVAAGIVFAHYLERNRKTEEEEEEINKLNIGEGQKILDLDYGCGIGSYTFPAANLVGRKGLCLG